MNPRAASVLAVARGALVLLALLVLCLSGCSEQAENALAYGGAALMGCIAFLLLVVCLSGFEIRRGGR